MKTNPKILFGGIAGMLTAIALLGGFVAWASSGSGGTIAADEPGAGEVAPLPSPRLEPELATTHRDPAPAPVAPSPGVDEPESFEPVLSESGAIRVRRLIVATGVSGHEPTGASDTFELGAQPRLYAFVEAANATDEDVQLRVTFEPEHGESAGHVALDVPASARRWRTWAFTRHVYEPGRWNVVVRAPDGRVVASRPFDVVR